MLEQKKKLYVRPNFYKFNNATCKMKKKMKYVQMKTKQTVIQRNGMRMDIADGFGIDTIGTTFFTMVRIKD